jgi:gamma-glutamyltranspeptidase
MEVQDSISNRSDDSCVVVHQLAHAATPMCLRPITLRCALRGQPGVREEVVEELKRMGHKIKYPVNAVGMDAIMTHTFGRAQVIVRDPYSGVLCAGSDGRADGCAMGW